MLSVVVTLGALFSFGAYYLALLPAESELMESEPVPSFFATDVQTPIHLPKDRSQFMSSLHEAVVRAQGRSVQLYPIVSSLQNTHVDVATAEEVLGVISPGLSGAFLRSLENEIMLGTIETTTREPFIIIRSFNFDTAFAGMLSWEPTMAADLSPFFDLRSLLEEGTETGIAPGASGFVDATRQNRSIRILYDKDSNERLIYAFVSRDTIVITESTDALAAIIDRL